MRALIAILAPAILLGAATARASEYPNIRISDPLLTDPEEVAIAINPADPDNVFVSANINLLWRSFDGGQTWTFDTLESPHGVWGDPSVIFDADGSLYHAHLSWPNAVEGDWLDRIVVQRSDDGGASFNDGSWAGLDPPKDQDKEWLAVDTTHSPFRGNLYMAWTEFDTYGSGDPADSTRILFSTSTDRATSWSAPVRVSDLGGDCIDEDDTMEGAVPAVGPDGQVYLAWAGRGVIWFDVSTNGGLNWGTDAAIATQPGGWDFAVPGIYRCNGLPVTLCDTGNSPWRGNLYVVWSDQREGADDTDIWFARSTDGGTSWSEPLNPVQEAGAHHQFFPWATIDPVTGYLYIVFYDRRETVGEYTDVWVAMSSDGGVNWTDFRVSESSFVPESWVFFGDYAGIAARRGHVLPAWMRMDAGELSVWTALVEIPLPTAAPPAAGRLVLGQNEPNPFNPATRIEFAIPVAAHTRLRVYDLQGSLVRTLLEEFIGAGAHSVVWDGRDERGRRVSSGVYLYELQAGDQSVTRKMTLVK